MISHYVVTAMTCQHCVNHVSEAVSALPGVTDVNLVLEGGFMAVTSEAEISFEDIAAAVGEAGDYTLEAR